MAASNEVEYNKIVISNCWMVAWQQHCHGIP